VKPGVDKTGKDYLLIELGPASNVACKAMQTCLNIRSASLRRI